MESNKAKVIAYYLPQFHPIKENDEWWGEGFTEWTNVGKAKALYKGHIQPRIPTTLGYYDLRLPEVRQRQADLAREAGIEGFMYWHYWFGNNKRILEMPFNEVLKSKEPDFPFCLGWANHSWRSDSWKSKSSSLSRPSLLIEQLYQGREEYTYHFNTLLAAFEDHRYIKIDNKPVFLVYSPLEVPDMSMFIDLWNELAIKNGFAGIHFIGLSKGWTAEVEKILALGFDAVNRNGQWEAECILKGKYSRILTFKMLEKMGVGGILDVYDYKKIVKNIFNECDKQNNVYPTILPQWDRSPRSGRQAVIYKDSSPEEFEKHLVHSLKLVKEKPEKDRIIFLKSWNEWGEGNYVEPDLKYGSGFLDVLRKHLVK